MTGLAIVTGATSGIGRAIAVSLGSSGHDVIVSGRNESEAALTVGAVEAAGAKAVAVIGDVTDSAFASALVEQAVAWFAKGSGAGLGSESGDESDRGLAVVVNAAGVIVRADAEGTTDDAWRHQMAVNVDSVFFVSRAAVPHLRAAGGGAIINVSSTCGLVGSAGLAGYCASKGAVISLTQAMALDHAAENIRINAVCPGAVDTPMLRSGRENAPMSDDEIMAMNIEDIPQARVPGPEEVAGVVAFLASPAARHITGAALPIDGGYTAQ